jgi:hypothetical protein
MDEHDPHVTGEAARVEAGEEVDLERRADEPLHPVHTGEHDQRALGRLGSEADHVDGQLLSVGAARGDGVGLGGEAGVGGGPAEAGAALVVGEGQAIQAHGAEYPRGSRRGAGCLR